MTKKTILISLIVIIIIAIIGLLSWKTILDNSQNPNSANLSQNTANSTPEVETKPSTPKPNESLGQSNIDDDDKEVDSILKELIQDEPSADPSTQN